MNTDVDSLSLLYEAVINLKKAGHKEITGKGIPKSDLSNFMFKHSGGGKEIFTVWTIRQNDSTTDRTKKKGDVLEVTGTLRIPKRLLKRGKMPSPLGNAKEKYDNYDLVSMYIHSINGIKYPHDSIRNINVANVFKLKLDKNEYPVT